MKTITPKQGAADLIAAIADAIDAAQSTDRPAAFIRLRPAEYEKLKAAAEETGWPTSAGLPIGQLEVGVVLDGPEVTAPHQAQALTNLSEGLPTRVACRSECGPTDGVDVEGL